MNENNQPDKDIRQKKEQKGFRLPLEDYNWTQRLIADSPLGDGEWFVDIVTKGKLYEQATTEHIVQSDITEMATLFSRLGRLYYNLLDKNLDAVEQQKKSFGKEVVEKEDKIEQLKNEIQEHVTTIETHRKDSTLLAKKLAELEQKYTDLVDRHAVQANLIETYKKQAEQNDRYREDYLHEVALREKQNQAYLEADEKAKATHAALEKIILQQSYDMNRMDENHQNETARMDEKHQHQLSIINLQHANKILELQKELQNEKEKAIQENQIRVAVSVAEKAVDHSFNPKELIELITGVRFEELLNRAEGETKERLTKFTIGLE
ncbi:hypothetical protein PTI45_03147 [Paenibacillus nuruki]|uniref:Uncharacterized protein n=1 Tax=Paenibacillus nuruki TaxID=1886670 RepID=A0A1E3L0W4_9BACL|nr:hypothetical protein [Paenibacillus nuruki]ODP27437.1 hypothetical protein PTI45_03147 [Paenibacillus nuruki]